MTTNREHTARGAHHRTTQSEPQNLDQRRSEMKAAEGHAGSIPRGNQQPEREVMGSHSINWERVLGH
jgi:hypothetical protein